MSSLAISDSMDYIKTLRNSRQQPAVLKLELATLKSIYPKSIVLALEGKDDKTVYYNWISKIESTMRYEPFPCGGKKNVLALIESIERDLDNIGENVYFIIDQDYDDNSAIAHLDSVYITEGYSFENSLVTKETVEELLKNDLHCHGHINNRQLISDTFERLYKDFLIITKEINFRLFVSKYFKITQISSLPEKISKLITLNLNDIQPSNFDPAEIVKLEREPTQAELAEALEKFNELNPEVRYRGKFAYAFFQKWLQLLVSDRNSDNSIFFRKVNDPSKASHITLDSIAAKSSPPKCFRNFVFKIIYN